MPDHSKHLAAHNNHHKSYEDTVEAHPDWAAIMLFYCAVHQVERLLATESEPVHCGDHGTRELIVKTRFQSFWQHYRALKAESLKARYLEGGMFSMNAERVRRDLKERRLAAIVNDVEARISARNLIPVAKAAPRG